MGRNIFSMAAWREKVLNMYAQVSGKCINSQKSSFYFFNTILDLQQRIARDMKCQATSLPHTYLELSIKVKKSTLISGSYSRNNVEEDSLLER